MPLLYYWRGDNYRRDLDMGAGYNLNQAAPLMHEIDVGDSLWAFTKTVDGRYVLAAQLIIRAKTFNPSNFRYGRYRIWGDIGQSRYFKVDNQPNAESIIRTLSCTTNASTLGHSFQGHRAVKRITQQDHLILNAAAQYLSLEPRAKILPEEELEATIYSGDEQAIRNLILRATSGIAEQRQEYLFRQAPTRNRKLVQDLHELYQGKCQLCLWDPKNEYGESLCHGHHLHWLSRGGDDKLDNMTLVCPNHHAAIHGCDAPFDFGDLTFDFGSHREVLHLNTHL